MTYTSLPNTGQSLGQTRAAIKNNFDLIKTTVDQNHVDFDLSGAGKHNVIQMPVTGSIPVNPIPPGGLVAGDANVYSKTANAASQIFFSPDASGNEYQLTRAIAANFATFGIANNGWTFLPGGLIMKYGTFLLVPSSFTTFTPPGPAFTNIPTSIVLTVNSSSSTDNAALWTNATTTQVDVRVFTGNRTVSYVIIGK